MRTTLDLDADLLERARKLTQIDGKTALIHAGLEALVAKAVRERLARLGGSEPALRAPRRRRAR
jgi:Arc/MetJ family transcription regulator